MSRNAFDQCARELEEREEYQENLRRERREEAAWRYLAQCDYCGAEHDERKMFNVDGDIICPECKAKIDQEEEDRDNPMNDDQLAALMQEKGYTMARRTVAKYRQQLNIPTSKVRKESYNL